MLSTLMLQGEEHQQMKSSQQHRYSLSATDMQQATTAERQALMDDTCQSVQVAAAVADIGAPQPADDRTEQDAAMPHQTRYSTISTMQSAVEQTRIADNLLLERLEQLAKSERLFSIAEHYTVNVFINYFNAVNMIVLFVFDAARRIQHMTLHEFSESTTFHGLKYIIQGNVTARRRYTYY
jgi:hypothetical protein